MFHTFWMPEAPCAEMLLYPIPWVPWGRIENSRAPGLLAAPPRFHRAPAAPAAAHRQGSRRPFGPRASKCVTTHFRGGLFGLPLPPPGLRRAPRVLSVRRKRPRFCAARRGKLAFLFALTRFEGPAP